MGTHPIFESDFDCLTESQMGRIKLRPRSEAPTQNSRIKRLIVQYELNKYLGHEVYNNGTAWFTVIQAK